MLAFLYDGLTGLVLSGFYSGLALLLDFILSVAQNNFFSF